MASSEDKIITTRLSNTRSIAGAITTLVICICLIPLFSQFLGGSKYIDSLKGAHSPAYPDVTFEDAFAKFYSDPQWKYYKSTTGDDIVSFTGKCMYDGKLAKVELRYLLNRDNTFQLSGGSLDGVEQNLLFMAQFAGQPFMEY